MTPATLASLIDRHGPVLEAWPARQDQAAARALLADSAAARTLLRQAQAVAAALRPEPGADTIDSARLERVIARTAAAARRTPQAPVPRFALFRWLDAVADGEGRWWRYGVPAAVGLVLGVVVGQASVDHRAAAESPAGVEALFTASHALEPFGL
jgi:hypothetical protein